MHSIKQNSFFKIISIILIISFLVMDISWANPDFGKTQTTTLAIPSMFSNNMTIPSSMEAKFTPMEKAGFLFSIRNIGDYFFGVADNIAIDRENFVAGVMRSELKADKIDIAPGIDLDSIKFENGIVYVPYQTGNKDYVITIDANRKVEIHSKELPKQKTISQLEKYSDQLTEIADIGFNGDKDAALKQIIEWQKDFKQKLNKDISVEQLFTIKWAEKDENATEYFKVVDRKGNQTGKIKPRDLVHHDGDWHEEVAVMVFDRQGHIITQRRSDTKLFILVD